MLRERPRQQRSWLSGIYYQCLSCRHPTTVPSDLNGGFDREELNNDHPFPNRLTQSIPAKKGEGITEVIPVSKALTFPSPSLRASKLFISWVLLKYLCKK